MAPGIVTIGIFKRAQPRAIFLGDSFVGNLVPSFNILARDLGVYFAGVLANGCFTLISEPEDRQELYINARKNGREECRASTRTAQRPRGRTRQDTTFFSYIPLVQHAVSSHFCVYTNNGTDTFKKPIQNARSYIVDRWALVALKLA
ncbi:hypothetical protein FVE85_4580 [Porphyridium purpureum]|uniref:Uncharacterized protein n=1 Tax=Porphyridium purpureum TaxID=35688 RepID=A0A5J4YH84_PORPP|nr:hypothetical protein FVE85_4580 [Porphyridium purpureum]|eukprot:POR3168..scf288_51